MKRLSILSLALFAAALTQQGAAWAQEDTKDENWGQVKTVTSEWTHITAGSTTGFELKDAYYYVTENLTFTNTNGGAGQGSGLYVQADKTVHLHIPAGVTITAIGADADTTSAAGAGILLPKGSTLYITGEGTLVATGGNAADGRNGSDGTPGLLDEQSVDTWFLGAKIYCGVGGAGGDGGGGAGAGIGTAGGNGGVGGPMIALNSPDRPQSYKDWGGGDLAGRTGDNGAAGDPAKAMGTLYIQPTIVTKITGGAKGNGGTIGGKPGKVSFTGGEIEIKDIHMVNGIPIPEVDLKDLQTVAGGGGGGAGAGGGSAQAIGTGGAGGGGGAAGACGSACAKNAWLASDWGSVGAGGGKGGKGNEDNNGVDGHKCWFQGDDSIFDDASNHKDGGKGGAAGAASVAKAAEAATAPVYNVKYHTVGVSAAKTSESYEVGNSATITLPTLTGGSGTQSRYKWLLSIYGNVLGTTTGHCAGPNGYVYAPGDVIDISTIYGAIEFCAISVGCEIDCTSKTSDKLNMAWNTWVTGKYTVIDLKNRTLYKDGSWNTLTLPFSLTPEKLATTSLAGADIRTFKSASWDKTNKALTINFSSENDGKIEAGVPCLIRWGEPGNAPGGTIENPTFSNVTLKMWDPELFEDDDEYNNYETESNGVRFQALIGSEQVGSNSRTLVLGEDNTFYRPNKSMYVYATHAYFTYTRSSGIAMTRSITLDFGDGEQETTYIDDIMVEDETPESTMEGIYNLNGQRLSAPQKGLNIINGKKVFVK